MLRGKQAAADHTKIPNLVDRNRTSMVKLGHSAAKRASNNAVRHSRKHETEEEDGTRTKAMQNNYLSFEARTEAVADLTLTNQNQSMNTSEIH